MAEKIVLFLSRMGAEVTCTFPNGNSVLANQSNEGPVRYLLQEHPDISEIICLVTKDSALEYFQTAFESPSLRLTTIPFDVGGEELIGTPLREVLSHLRPEDKIYLETTGGTRDVIMFFLLLTRILSYQGIAPAGATYGAVIEKGKSVVKDVDHLNAMFDLVGGMQELTSFGSVRTLRKYYGAPAKDARIERLLKSAENLMETIALCRTEQMDGRLKRFNEAVAEAEACDDVLLTQLLPVFRKKFWDGRDMTMPGLIQWCLNSDMIQQALTIYKEKMPGYLLSQSPLLEWKQRGALNASEEEKRKERNQSREEALFRKYFLSLERKYARMKAGQFDGAYQSDFLAIRCSTEQISVVAKDYLYIRALQNMVNHADDRAEGESQKEAEHYLTDCLNSQGRRYKRLSEVTTRDVKQIVRDALENLKPRADKPGKRSQKRKKGAK